MQLVRWLAGRDKTISEPSSNSSQERCIHIFFLLTNTLVKGENASTSYSPTSYGLNN